MDGMGECGFGSRQPVLRDAIASGAGNVRVRPTGLVQPAAWKR
jgi:hypothetical protein